MRMFRVGEKQPHSGAECITFFWDRNVPQFGSGTYFEKGDKLKDLLRDFEGAEEMTREQRLLHGLGLLGTREERKAEESGFYRIEEDTEGNLRYQKIKDPISFWAPPEIPLETGDVFIDCSSEERSATYNMFENLLRFLDHLEKEDLSRDEICAEIKEWVKDIVGAFDKGYHIRVGLVDRMLREGGK